MTPVVNAQLDDPYCLNGVHHWLANWQLRAEEAAQRASTCRQSKSADYPPPHRRRCGPLGFANVPMQLALKPSPRGGGTAAATAARPDRRRHGELLGGLPTRSSRWHRGCASSRCEDLADALAHRPKGIWAPECATPRDGGHLPPRGQSHGRRPIAAQRHRAGPAGGKTDVVAFGLSRLAGQPGESPKSTAGAAARLPRLMAGSNRPGSPGVTLPSGKRHPTIPKRAPTAVDVHVAGSSTWCNRHLQVRRAGPPT